MAENKFKFKECREFKRGDVVYLSSMFDDKFIFLFHSPVHKSYVLRKTTSGTDAHINNVILLSDMDIEYLDLPNMVSNKNLLIIHDSVVFYYPVRYYTIKLNKLVSVLKYKLKKKEERKESKRQKEREEIRKQDLLKIKAIEDNKEREEKNALEKAKINAIGRATYVRDPHRSTIIEQEYVKEDAPLSYDSLRRTFLEEFGKKLNEIVVYPHDYLRTLSVVCGVMSFVCKDATVNDAMFSNYSKRMGNSYVIFCFVKELGISIRKLQGHQYRLIKSMIGNQLATESLDAFVHFLSNQQKIILEDTYSTTSKDIEIQKFEILRKQSQIQNGIAKTNSAIAKLNKN